MTKKDYVPELQTAQKSGNLKPSQIKKSRSVEELKSKPDKQISTLQNQVKFEAQKAQNYLEQITKLTAELDAKEQINQQLVQEKNALTDQNNELRFQRLKDLDALKASQTNEDQSFTQYQQSQQQNSQLKLQLAHTQKALTYTQQDLKSAQGIIELRLLEKQTNPQPNYWKWISLFLGGLLCWSWLKGINHA